MWLWENIVNNGVVHPVPNEPTDGNAFSEVYDCRYMSQIKHPGPPPPQQPHYHHHHHHSSNHTTITHHSNHTINTTIRSPGVHIQSNRTSGDDRRSCARHGDAGPGEILYPTEGYMEEVL